MTQTTPHVDNVIAIMSTRYRAIAIGATVAEAKAFARSECVHHLVVADEGEVLGVVCLCDLDRAEPETRIGHCMHSPFVFVCEGWSPDDAARVMRECHIGFLPVMDDAGRLLGVLSRGDLRRVGLFDEDAASLRCAACGAAENVVPPLDPRGVAFCASCLDQVSSSIDDIYFTLGGGD